MTKNEKSGRLIDAISGFVTGMLAISMSSTTLQCSFWNTALIGFCSAVLLLIIIGFVWIICWAFVGFIRMSGWAFRKILHLGFG
jgi:hypothetical protein